jgi:hypothetical protein
MAMNSSVVVGVLVLVLLFIVIMKPKWGVVSKYIVGASLPRSGGAGGEDVYSTLNATENNYMTGGMGVSSSMLPKEIPSQEDFGSFSPSEILSGQNYLDPRAQIGYPETLGGVLRNANRDVRSEPPNPRTPVSIFNNSTIVPDLMRPYFEIGQN